MLDYELQSPCPLYGLQKATLSPCQWFRQATKTIKASVRESGLHFFHSPRHVQLNPNLLLAAKVEITQARQDSTASRSMQLDQQYFRKCGLPFSVHSAFSPMTA